VSLLDKFRNHLENRTILVIIDVQTQYAGHRAIANACAALALEARDANRPIFVVEYIGNGETHTAITQKLIKYERTFTVRKESCDGSQAIRAMLRQTKLQPDNFLICGLYRNDCVLATVEGLAAKYPKSSITVDMNAVYDIDRPMNDKFNTLPQVQIK
jgi:nicotinamidase-related amidase